jgi:hypothetical protein
LYKEEELPSEFKLYLPVQKSNKNAAGASKEKPLQVTDSNQKQQQQQTQDSFIEKKLSQMKLNADASNQDAQTSATAESKATDTAAIDAIDAASPAPVVA